MRLSIPRLHDSNLAMLLAPETTGWVKITLPTCMALYSNPMTRTDSHMTLCTLRSKLIGAIKGEAFFRLSPTVDWS